MWLAIVADDNEGLNLWEYILAYHMVILGIQWGSVEWEGILNAPAEGNGS